MPKLAPVSFAVLVLSVLLLAACRPSLATESAIEASATQPGYPPPTKPTQADSPTPNIQPTTTGEPSVSPHTSEPYPAPTTPNAKATPVGDSPAAGVCDLQEGDLVTFEINADIPSPRCAQAYPGQGLKVINRTDYELEVSIASFEDTLAPSEEMVINAPLGGYLLPGVHVIATSAYSGGGGPELWLLEADPTEAPYPAP